MTFENLFLAGLAVGLGFSFSKMFCDLWSDWISTFWQDWKKLRYIFTGIFIFLFFVYLQIALSSRQLF